MKECQCGCCKGREKKNLECDCDVIHEDLVERAKARLIDDDILLSIADFYKAMSDSTRIKILNLLEVEELCVCDIASVLNMTKSAVSHQLKNLKEMSLVKADRRGKEIWYSLADRHVKCVFDVSLEHILEDGEDEKNC